MCKPVKDWLNVLREYTKEVITFGGFVLCIFVYLDFKEMNQQMLVHIGHTNEILRTLSLDMNVLKAWHANEETRIKNLEYWRAESEARSAERDKKLK